MAHSRGSMFLCTAVLAFTQTIFGQAFNVNFAPSEEFPGPSASYGGAGTAGVWNQYVDNFEEPFALVDTGGVAGSATVTLFNAGGRLLGGDIIGAGGSADDAALLFGKFNSLIGDGGRIQFNGLSEGVYEVITYAWNDQVTFQQGSRVTVIGANEGPQDCGGVYIGSHQLGVTYTKHTVATLTGSLEILINENSFGAACNGVQIRRTGTSLVGVTANSVNVDFSSSQGTPPNSYGAVGSAGVWNTVNTAPGMVRLRGLNGSLTDSLMTLEGSSQFGAIFTFPSDYHSLQFDFWTLADGVPFPSQNVIRFSHLSPGNYRVLTYVTYGGPTGATVSVDVTGSPDGTQHAGGEEAEDHTLGVTYTDHDVVVVAAGTLEIFITRDNYAGGVTGVQLVPSTTPTCPADFNNDGTRDVADLFGYINAWLAKTANADFNHDTHVDVADLFGYINAWLAGC